MARPKILRPTDGGEISFKNCTPETFEKLKAALESAAPLASPAPALAAPAPVAAAVSEDTPLTNTALSTFKYSDGVNFGVATIAYNPNTKSAKVVSLDKVGTEREYAIERFKILAVKNGLV